MKEQLWYAMFELFSKVCHYAIKWNTNWIFINFVLRLRKYIDLELYEIKKNFQMIQ